MTEIGQKQTSPQRAGSDGRRAADEFRELGWPGLSVMRTVRYKTSDVRVLVRGDIFGWCPDERRSRFEGLKVDTPGSRGGVKAPDERPPDQRPAGTTAVCLFRRCLPCALDIRRNDGAAGGI